MSIFRNKILTKIVAVLCIILTITNIGMPSKVYAEETWGGILITPITKLLTSIADGIMSIMQQAAIDQEVTIVEVSGNASGWDSWGKKLVTGIIIAIVVVVVVAASIASAGGFAAFAAGGAAAFAAGTKVVAFTGLSVLAIAGVNHVVVEYTDGKYTSAVELLAETLGDWWFNDESLYLPAFSLTPEEIFSNQIPLLDVNFFDPMENVLRTREELVVEQTKNFNWESLTKYAFPWAPETGEEYKKGSQLNNALKKSYAVLEQFAYVNPEAEWIEYDEDDWERTDELYDYGDFKYAELGKVMDHNNQLKNAYDWLISLGQEELVKDLFKTLEFPIENISNDNYDYYYKYVSTEKSSDSVYVDTGSEVYYYFPYLVTKIQILYKR